ncbi:LPS export ABC transporter periplasmic protein LptC [Piscirickettsia litoralis]|uniref:LPS export ABC transporter periplasmic protein LptC n=1 Tax=Piscirickettsia litoralis TaxID=1891921 RepID=A0ABX3A0W9_9GAMM|nr:LPS export ABC transporter periplasmic protein LptC [Piscirickettsia litoralis]ODN42506.1 LPS export ABC transporter periplasmic protein LptC [Piscirickettsia litoralis]
MLRQTFFSSLLLLLFAGLSSWLVIETSRPNSNSANQGVTQDAKASDITVATFTAEGALRYIITSPTAKHFDNNTSTITTPHLTVLAKTGSNWSADAKLATVKNNIIHLTGNVRLNRPASKLNQAVLLTTSLLNFNIDKNLATSSEKVTVSEPGTSNYIQGTGLRADLNKGTVQLLKQVRSHYEIN